MADDSADTMSYEAAISRIPDRELPEFWVGSLEGLNERLDGLDRGRVEEIARSAGGRPIELVSYGAAQPPERRANYNSAVAGRDPTTYVDRDDRERPVVFLVGPVHGHEVEGLTGLCNFLSVLETGSDLRGEKRSTLRELGDQCRLLVLPCGNPDGLARFEPGSLLGTTLADLEFWGQGTWPGERLMGWPDVKKKHPMRGDDVGFLGCYFNDEGVNPMHDEFFDPMGTEAPAILDVARREAPDATLSLHSHGYPPMFHRTKYVPLDHQADARSIHRTYNSLLADRGLPTFSPIDVAAESGTPPPYFNLVSAVHHTSGTLGLLHECPHGLTGETMCDVTHEDILEIQLSLYEAVLRHAVEAGGA